MPGSDKITTPSPEGTSSAPTAVARRPLPSGARVLTLDEVRDGVRLTTGREHVLVMPAPRLVVEGPAAVPTPPAGPTAIVSQRGAPKSFSPEPGPKTLWITHPGTASTPTMPDLEGFRVRVDGVSPDPAPGLTFEWTLTLDYATLARSDRRLVTQVVWKVVAPGGVLPPDAFRRAPGTVLKVGRPVAVKDPPALGTTPVAGGRLTIDVATTLPGVGRLAGRLAGYVVLAWDNPSKAAMRAYLVTQALGAPAFRGDVVDPVEASWVADVFCAETHMMQFSHVSRGPYRRAFHPLANNGGDGGVGLGQLTHPESTTVQEVWDWRANARTSLAIYRNARRVARKYVAFVRDELSDLPTAGALGDAAQAVQALVAFRRAAGLPALARIDVPDYTAQQLREDAARGYNGFKPAKKGHPQRPQFGKSFHEFRLETEGTPARVRVVNERSEGSVRVADAIWVRVPDEERPPGPEAKRYVEDHVLKPDCP